MIILSVIMLCSGVFPFGDMCILKTDMYHQYAPFFSEFREKLQNGGSLGFSWNLGLGVNFTAIMAYYLASPFNWAAVLAGENYILEFMTVLIVLKAGLSAAAMAAYLRYKSPDEYLGAYLFSLFYALSGYYCAYYWNIMWLDCIVLFPLIIMGAEKLLKGDGGLLYGISLGMCILSNYYISIMICIFLVIYFFMFGILEGFGGIRGFFLKGIRFAVWSLAAGAFAAVLLFPEIKALQYTVSADSEFPKMVTEYFSVFDMLSRHMAGVETEQWLKHFPNIYCGTGVYLFFCLYIMSARIPLKEKAVYIFAALFLLMGFSVNVLNFLWHGFRFPNSLPARQSFIYCFLLIFMCFRVYENRDGIVRKEIGTALAASCAFILLSQKLTDSEQFPFWAFYLALLLTGLYAGVLHVYRKGRASVRTAAAAAVLLAVAELSANTAVTSFTTTSRSDYLKNNDEIRLLVSDVREKDTDLYRIERENRKTKDDGAWLNFPSVSVFSSVANADCSRLFTRLGCEASTNAYSITGSTPLVDMLLGVKYCLSLTEPEQMTEGKTLEAQKGDVYLYRNGNCLPVGYALPADMNSGWLLELTDPVLVQNSLCDSLGAEQILKPVQGENSGGGEYTLTIPEEGEYYAYAAGNKADKVTVSRADRKKTFEHLDRHYLMELGKCDKGELIRFRSEDNNPADIRVYRFDHGVLSDICDKMSKYTLDIDEYRDGFISGRMTVDTEKLGYGSGSAFVMISTPFDEGWKVTVDGEPVTIYKGLDTFLGFYLPDGSHRIEMQYEPSGLKEGMAVTGLALLFFIGCAAARLIHAGRTPQEGVSDKNGNEASEEPQVFKDGTETDDAVLQNDKETDT